MANRTKWTPKKNDSFLDLLRETGNVTLAARACGMSRSRIYELRQREQAFADAWDDAVEEALDRIEREVLRRAVEGVEEPVFYQGKVCGHIRRYSDNLLMFFLKAHRPDKYRERYEVRQDKPGSVNILIDTSSGRNKPKPK